MVSVMVKVSGCPTLTGLGLAVLDRVHPANTAGSKVNNRILDIVFNPCCPPCMEWFSSRSYLAGQLLVEANREPLHPLPPKFWIIRSWTRAYASYQLGSYRSSQRACGVCSKASSLLPVKR